MRPVARREGTDATVRTRSRLRPLLWGPVTFAVLYSVCCGGCAQPIKGLWPPAAGARTRLIVVSVDRWHSVIALPAPSEDPPRENAGRAGPPRRWEEWGYAEEGYYLEGDTGCSGTLRALFVPSSGVVQVGRTPALWSQRTPQPPARSWAFCLSEKGYERLVEFLEGAKKSPDVMSSALGYSWYHARESYHVFHHCHHWTAGALRSAGLPVWSAYALLKSCLEAQLDRALEFQTAALTGGDDSSTPST